MQILDVEDGGAPACQCLENLHGALEQAPFPVLGRLPLQFGVVQGIQAAQIGQGVALGTQQSPHVGFHLLPHPLRRIAFLDPPDPVEQVDERIVGDGLGVVVGAPFHPGEPLFLLDGPELLDEAALAPPGLAAHGYDRAFSITQAVRSLFQRGHLHLAADQLSSQTREAAGGGGAFQWGHQPVYFEGLGFAFDLDGIQLLKGERAVGEGAGLRPHQDVAGRGQVGQA